MSVWDGLPVPDERAVSIRLKRSAERPLRKGHPWIFDQGIEHQNREGAPGDLALLFSAKRKLLGLGLYDPRSPIRVKMLHRGKSQPIDDEFFAHRLHDAIEVRAGLEAAGTTGYRVVHGENDGLPGFVVDRYGETLVVKLYSAIWVPRLRQLIPPLLERLRARRLVLRFSRRLQGHPEDCHGLSEGQILLGPLLDGPIAFQENHLTFLADPIRGQKTGFFLDQRDNRARVGTLAKGKRVLNVFSYSGGFSLYAARGGASEVISLDSSQPALETAEQIFARNHDHPAIEACRHELLCADAFAGMVELETSGRRFDLVIIDPPAFAKKSAEVKTAYTAYARLMRLGLKLLVPGGDLVFASCSSRVPSGEFRERMLQVAAQAGRPLQDLEVTTHGIDHPIDFPEGAYLKCLFAQA